MSKPAVSVIIPTYNRIALLRQALDSVQAQTFRDFETIVVDDGSTEDVESLIKTHPIGARLLRQNRKGPASARNTGIAAANGELLAFLDSDDLWLPSKLERYVAALRSQNSCELYYGPMRPMDSNGNWVKGRTKTCHMGWITDELFCKCFVHVPTVVCRRELLLKRGGFCESLSVCEDYELWLRLSVHHEFGLIDEPLALRRLHDDRLSKTDMHRNLAVKSHMLERFYESGQAGARLSQSVARSRLARVFCAAAKAAFRAGYFAESLEYCNKSAGYAGSGLKTLPLSVMSRILISIGAGQDNRPPTSAGDMAGAPASPEAKNPSYACRTFPGPEDRTSATAIR